MANVVAERTSDVGESGALNGRKRRKLVRGRDRSILTPAVAVCQVTNKIYGNFSPKIIFRDSVEEKTNENCLIFNSISNRVCFDKELLLENNCRRNRENGEGEERKRANNSRRRAQKDRLAASNVETQGAASRLLREEAEKRAIGGDFNGRRSPRFGLRAATPVGVRRIRRRDDQKTSAGNEIIEPTRPTEKRVENFERSSTRRFAVVATS